MCLSDLGRHLPRIQRCGGVLGAASGVGGRRRIGFSRCPLGLRRRCAEQGVVSAGPRHATLPSADRRLARWHDERRGVPIPPRVLIGSRFRAKRPLPSGRMCVEAGSTRREYAEGRRWPPLTNSAQTASAVSFCLTSWLGCFKNSTIDALRPSPTRKDPAG